MEIVEFFLCDTGKADLFTIQSLLFFLLLSHHSNTKTSDKTSEKSTKARKYRVTGSTPREYTLRKISCQHINKLLEKRRGRPPSKSLPNSPAKTPTRRSSFSKQQKSPAKSPGIFNRNLYLLFKENEADQERIRL